MRAGIRRPWDEGRRGAAVVKTWANHCRGLKLTDSDGMLLHMGPSPGQAACMMACVP